MKQQGGRNHSNLKPPTGSGFWLVEAPCIDGRGRRDGMAELFGLSALLIGLLFVLALATGFGFRRPRLSAVGPGSDRSLLTSRPGTYGGAVAAVIAATGLSGIAPLSGPSGRIVLVLILVLGAAVAVGGGSGIVREVLYIGIGIGATLTALAELFGGACGEQMPSTLATVFAVVPLGVMVLSAVFLGPWGGRRGSVLGDVGPLALAGFVFIELGTVAAYPAGVPALNTAIGTGNSWAPLVLLLIVCVIAVSVGAHPRAGADLCAMGLLVLTGLFLAFDTPCGLRLTNLIVVGLTFGASLGAVSMVRARLSTR